jgi:hypothetical protein
MGPQHTSQVSRPLTVSHALHAYLLPSVFERHHRFIGWSGLVFTWVFVVLGDSYDINTHQWNPDGIHILRQQEFWFSLGMTIL